MVFCPKCGTDVVDGARFCPSCGNVMPKKVASSAPQDPLIGRKLDDKFLIEELLGVGGMGRVYKAVQLSLDKVVCVKVLRAGSGQDETLTRRFHREARASSRLNHPNSISIIDFGQEPQDGALYMAMEFIPGKDLGKIIHEEFPLGEKRIVHIMDQVLSALADAHAAGIVHRDLKPENIMVTDLRGTKDFVKVLDFGIAKIQENSQDPALTQAGMVCGTPEYMSPEQARGEPLDARSDLYAAGVILYQMVTGKIPFTAPTAMGIVTKHLVEPPVPPSKIPGVKVSSALEAVILKAMSKDKNGRQATALALQQELNAVLNQKRAPAQQAPQGQDLFDNTPAGPASAEPAPTILRDNEKRGTDEIRSQRQPAAPVSAPADVRATPPPKSGSGLVLWLVLGLVVLGGAVAGLYFFVLNGHGDSPSTDTDNPIVADAGGSVKEQPANQPQDGGVLAAPSSTDTNKGPNPSDTSTASTHEDAGTVVANVDSEPTATQEISEVARMNYQAAKELMARRRFSKAIILFKKALKASPGYADAYKALGTCYISVGKTEKAKKVLMKYLELKPNAKDREAIEDMIDTF